MVRITGGAVGKRPNHPTRRGSDGTRKAAWHWLILLSGWIAAALVGVLNLPRELNSFYAQKDEAWLHIAPKSANPATYIGRWTNDPDLRPDENLITGGSPQVDHGTVQLYLRQDKAGGLSGEIVTTLLGRSMVPWSRVNITGHVSPLGGFRGEAWDIVGNRQRVIADFRLAPSDDVNGQAIRFSAKSEYSRYVPPETILWRTDATMSGGHFGDEYIKALMNIARHGG